MTPSQSGELAERHWVFYAAELCRPFVDKVPVGIGLSWGKEHLTYMLGEIAQEKMSATKACRWLGWIQACVVFSGVTTLEGMKELNKVASTSSALDLSPFAVPQDTLYGPVKQASDGSLYREGVSTSTAPSPVGLVENWPECREFYDLMQTYRHVNQRGYLGEKYTVAAYEAVKAWLRTAAEQLQRDLDSYRRASPLCDKHKPDAGTRGDCLVCTCETLSAALSQIDYLCGESNDTHVSGYDLHYAESVVVENVKKLRGDLDAAMACINDAPVFTLDERIINGWKNKHAAAIALAHREPAGGEGKS